MDLNFGSMLFGSGMYERAHGSGTSAQNVDSPSSGLSMSDLFGDEIRELEQAAAERQMQYQTTSAREAMQFSAAEAQKNRDFQERMSNSAYTRAVADMKNAGLNPVLAAGASPASTPSGSSASGISQSGSKANVSDYNSALQVAYYVLDSLKATWSSTTSLINAIIPG